MFAFLDNETFPIEVHSERKEFALREQILFL